MTVVLREARRLSIVTRTVDIARAAVGIACAGVPTATIAAGGEANVASFGGSPAQAP